MLINVRVVPRSSRSKVVEENGNFKVYVHAPADEGRANKELIELLADHFNTPKSSFVIVQGSSCRNKVISINERE